MPCQQVRFPCYEWAGTRMAALRKPLARCCSATGLVTRLCASTGGTAAMPMWTGLPRRGIAAPVPRAEWPGLSAGARSRARPFRCSGLSPAGAECGFGGVRLFASRLRAAFLRNLYYLTACGRCRTGCRANTCAQHAALNTRPLRPGCVLARFD